MPENHLQPLSKFLPFAPPFMDQDEIEEITKVIKSGWLTLGPKTLQFEEAMAEYLGQEKTLALSSCTAALHLALKVLDLGQGQGAITTPLTFASTAHAVLYCGARPFLVDISENTGNLDPQAVREFLEKKCLSSSSNCPIHQETGLKITTLIPVHYGGLPVDLKSFWDLAEEFNLNIVEDAAHALGSYYQGQPIGHPDLKPKKTGLYNLTAFSFYATKNITTAEGGLLVASHPELLSRARRLSAYGISDGRQIWGKNPKGSWDYDILELGFKNNFTDLQAALGLCQLKKLPDFIKARTSHAATYQKILSPLKDRLIIPQSGIEATSSWHLFPLRLNLKKLTKSREYFINELKALNVGTSVMFKPLHFHSFYQKTLGYPKGSFPKAENFYHSEISLPLSPAHRSDDIEQVARLVSALIERETV
jgi:dTDP-4-amino-4,6-dideoxygalactose transaminase